jgi:hypothetical protein
MNPYRPDEDVSRINESVQADSGIWHLASGIWRLASGVWRLASGIVVSRVRFLMPENSNFIFSLAC